MQNEWENDIIIYTGLRSVDINLLKNEPSEANKGKNLF